MMHSFNELIIGGVLLSPALFYVGLTLAIALAIRPLLHRIKFSRWFSNAAVAELSLYAAIFGLLIQLG